MVGHVTVSDKIDPVNVTLLTGESRVWKGNCDVFPTEPPTTENLDNEDEEQCPHIYLAYDNKTECLVSNNCSKVTCVIRDEGPRQVLTLQMNGCSKPLTVTVTYTEQASPFMPTRKWSQTFKDGEKAGLPVPPGDDVKPFAFFKITELKEKNAMIHFKVKITAYCRIAFIFLSKGNGLYPIELVMIRTSKHVNSKL